jgi:hypothetical protein
MNALAPLEPIQFPAPPKPAAPGAPGYLLWIPISKLRIDSNYQRPVLNAGRANIKRMVEEFSWSLFAPLIVAPREGGTYAVIDGQHRAIAAITHGGITELPALSIVASPAIEARAFAVINGMVTRVSSLSIHRAMVAAGDDEACAADAACAEAGVKILAYPKTDCRPGETLAVGTIKDCLKRFGRAVLVDSMRIVTQTGDGNPGMLREGIVLGGCDVLAAHPAWRKHPGFFDAFKKTSVTALYRVALAAKAAEGRGAHSVRSYYADVLKAHFLATLGAAAPAASVKPSVKPASKPERPAKGKALARSPRVQFAAAPVMPSISAKVPKPDASAAIAAYLAKGGKVTKVIEADTGNPQILKDFLVGRGVPITFAKGEYFHKNRKIDVEGLRRLAAAERQKLATAGR